MNFLAHTYLSGCNEEIIVGNFMGDYVKGSRYMDFPEMVKKGILIHRDIDTFTDMHLITRRSKQMVAAKYSKYAGIIIDIFYDHFLASLWDDYSNLPLSDFVNKHPAIKVLALSFLLMIGVALIADGMDFPLPKGYIYFSMAFAVFVEFINHN